MNTFEKKTIEKSNELSGKIIGALIEVHRELGPGLPLETYEQCISIEFDKRGIEYKRNTRLPLIYKGKEIPGGMLADFIVEDLIVLILKKCEEANGPEKIKMLKYLKLTEKWLGLIINFNVKYLKDGITRVANGF